MVLSYQIHHFDKRNCKKKERTYQTLGWKGNQHKGQLLPGSLKIWRGKLDSNIGDDNDDDNEDDNHDNNEDDNEDDHHHDNDMFTSSLP